MQYNIVKEHFSAFNKMKRYFLLVLLFFCSTYFSHAQHYKKDGTPDRRYKENKTSYSTPTPKYSSPSFSGSHYKADGTPDRRYKENNSGYARERDSKGRYIRSSSAKTSFKKQTGYPHGRPGYVIDHIIPLKKGGCDCPENMQWQTVADAKAKDKWEMP